MAASQDRCTGLSPVPQGQVGYPQYSASLTGSTTSVERATNSWHCDARSGRVHVGPIYMSSPWPRSELPMSGSGHLHYFHHESILLAYFARVCGRHSIISFEGPGQGYKSVTSLRTPIPTLTSIMQFKLIALLTLAVASVNGTAHYERGGELGVHPLHWFTWLQHRTLSDLQMCRSLPYQCRHPGRHRLGRIWSLSRVRYLSCHVSWHLIYSLPAILTSTRIMRA